MIAYAALAALAALGLFAVATAAGRWVHNRAPKTGTWPQHPLP
jgi:hypothetical protein